MWIFGAVASDLLVAVTTPDLVNVMNIGTSPAPANAAGKVKLIMSKPGISGFELLTVMASAASTVEPMVTLSSVCAANLTPVKLSSTTVGTVLPLASIEVILNGGGNRKFGLVTLTAIAFHRVTGRREDIGLSTDYRGQASNRSVCACVYDINDDVAKPVKFRWEHIVNLLFAIPTKYKPAAPPFTATDTPFNSTGNAGLRFVSEAPVVTVTVLGARLTVERTILNSPGARPIAAPGEGLGVGVGLGVGLGTGVAVGTAILLAPVLK